ncbi:hypothetical protein KCP69_15640 [Salmonella enterica subsp. enterica]|nr:hypothetical protein KCP69_15640 [Salmonella enterica subsp. enterica]
MTVACAPARRLARRLGGAEKGTLLHWNWVARIRLLYSMMPISSWRRCSRGCRTLSKHTGQSLRRRQTFYCRRGHCAGVYRSAL